MKNGIFAALALATISLLAPTNVGAQQSCNLDRGTNTYLSEGATDFRLHPASTGTLRVAVIFVDFPDAPADESAEVLYNSFMPGAVSWFDRASFGRFAFAPQPVFRWFRMPLPSTSYAWNTFQSHRIYVNDAIGVANQDVDFAGTQAVYVVSSKGAKFPISPTMLGNPGSGVMADGVEFRLGVTFGNDIRGTRASYGTHVAVHETLHILGLPDLYSFDGGSFANFHRFVGGWDIMGWVSPGANLLAWHGRKLGWLDQSQMLCVSGGVTTATLSPVETSGGVKAISARLSNSRSLVIEHRSLTGLDAGLCDQGLLVYTVDASTKSGAGPVQVVAAADGADNAQISRCGVKYAAPFDIGPGEIPTYIDPSGIRIEVLGRNAAGMEVRVSYPGSARRRSTRK